MNIGGSLVTIAVGAILRFAVTKTTVASVSVHTVGTILLIVGLVWLLISLFLMFAGTGRRRDTIVERERPVVRDREYL
jgi:hypothetical protein